MKKIMFNDKYGLTRAVIEGEKTQTRRIVPEDIINAVDTLCLISFSEERLTEKEKDYNCYETCDGDFIDVRDVAKYKRGEEVAVAQSYKDARVDPFFLLSSLGDGVNAIDSNGWDNKMFVRADLMPHRIKITNIRVERLQDISDEDCLQEGIHTDGYKQQYYCASGFKYHYSTPHEAFAVLIDKTCGKGTWESNPWVFVYDFELINNKK